jgi:competence protein ComEC
MFLTYPMFTIRNVLLASIPLSKARSWRGTFLTRSERLWSRTPMVCLLGVCLASIAIQEFLGSTWSIFLFLATLAATAYAIAGWRNHRSRFSRRIALCLCLGIATFVGLWHSDQVRREELQREAWQASLSRSIHNREFAHKDWKPIVCRGIIESALRYRKTNQLRNQPALPEEVNAQPPSPASSSNDRPAIEWQSITTIRVSQLRSGKEWQDCNFLMPAVVNGRLASLLPGDVIEVYGNWKLPSPPTNPGQFDQALRYSQLGYSAQLSVDSENQIKHLPSPSRLRIDRLLAKVARQAQAAIDRYVILGHSEMAAALVLGQREQAEWRLQEELLATGTIHMLSISGMHIEMIAISLLMLGAILQIPQKSLLLGVCVFVVGYALLCGGNPPVARAAMMLIGICVARWFGWAFSSMNFLAFSGIVLVLIRTNVVFETGTQLSYLAVAVLISSTGMIVHRSDSLRRLMESKESSRAKTFRSVLRWSAEMIRTSFWVWLITTPLVWSSFHVISPIAILLNLLLWLPMLLGLLSGLGLIVVGWFPPAGWLLGIVCGTSLWTADCIIGVSEAIPLGHFWLRSPPMWWLYSFYALAIGIGFWGGWKKRRFRRMLLVSLSLWFLIGLLTNPILDQARRISMKRNPTLGVTFLHVGHGTCVLIESPDGASKLYDAGRLGDHQRSYQTIVEALWAMRIGKIDTIYLSHADSDHYNAVFGIAKRFSIKQLVTTEQVCHHPSPLLKENLRSATNRGAKLEVWSKGDGSADSQVNTIALHPPIGGVTGSDNANSLCIFIEFAGRKILLPGDLEPPGMKLLVGQQAIDVDILMAPHHGSVTAKADLLLDWCQPEYVVISGSSRALSPRVLKNFENESRQVFVTSRDHAIRFEINSKGEITTKRWNQNRWSP